MHPLELLNEAELGSLIRVADRLLNTRHLLAPGQRPNRQRAGFGIEFLDHCEYSPGDDIRNVDWRATARSRHPQIRRYCDEADTDWNILIDISSSMAFAGAAKWQLAVQCAAAMAYLLIHQGNRVSLVLFSDEITQMIPMGRGYSHYANILFALRQATPPEQGSGSDLRCCVARIRRNSAVFVISDFLTANNMQDGLDALSSRADRLHALQIFSDRDYHLPSEQGVRFKDVETGQTIDADIGDQQGLLYQQAVDNFKNTLVNYCRKRHIHFSRHAHHEFWKSVLVGHLKTGDQLA